MYLVITIFQWYEVIMWILCLIDIYIFPNKIYEIRKIYWAVNKHLCGSDEEHQYLSIR